MSARATEGNTKVRRRRYKGYEVGDEGVMGTLRVHEHHATLRSDSAPATVPDMGTGSNSAKTIFWSPPLWPCEK